MLTSGDDTTVTFTLSETVSGFAANDIIVTNGTLKEFAGSDLTYTATFTPAANFNGQATIDIAANNFTDTVGNGNVIATQEVITIDTTSPIVTTKDASEVAQFSANLAGEVTDQGGSVVTDRGIVYALSSEESNPTLDATNVTSVAIGSDIGKFDKLITGLQASTEYAYVAYATNTSGTGYGTVKTFTTLDLLTPTITFTDITDKVYGDANFDLAATSNSDGAISYAIIPGGTGTASIGGINNRTCLLYTSPSPRDS